MATVLGGLLAIGLIYLVFYFFVRVEASSQRAGRREHTYKELAEDFDLWNKHVNNPIAWDKEKDMERKEHGRLSVEEKVEILTRRFGKERKK